MNEINLLKNKLSSSFYIMPTETGYNNKKIRLDEPDDNYHIDISGIPETSITIKTDLFPALSDIVFIGNDGECKRSDYAIILQKEDKKIILLIELKSKRTTSTFSDIKKQLKGGMCVIEYIKLIGREFWNNVNFLNDYEYRFVAISDIKINKRRTKNRPETTIHNNVENTLRITAAGELYLNHLINQPSNLNI